MHGIFGLAISRDTVVKIQLTNGLIYFGSRLLNIVVFRTTVNVAILQFYRSDCYEPVAYGLSSSTI